MFAQLTERLRQRYEWFDISVLKLCMIAFTLWLATLLPVLVSVSAWVWFVVWFVLMIWLLWRLLG
jgi:hypothetical protein